MKKILSFLLILALLLPCAALADTAVDVGLGTLYVDDDAIVQAGEKTDGGILAIIIPSPDTGAAFYDNITVMWESGLLTDIDMSGEEFAQLVVDASVAGMAAQGMTIANQQVVDVEFDAVEGYYFLYYTLDADYSGLGLDLQTTLHFVQIAMSLEDDGTYTFTLTSATQDGITALLECLETLEEEVE